ncbi:MAG: PP2C family protein-serine/threonine phosphatase [Sporichthyaceae bacterium]
MEGTVAGRCFTDVSVQGSVGAIASRTGFSVWAPVLDGTDRLGVLELVFDEEVELDEGLVTDVGLLAALVAELVMSRSLIGDFVERERRRLPMLLEAELQWNLLPPLTFASTVASIAGVLAPTNEVAGDSFDYAVNGDIAHLCIVDAMGHGLDATLMSAVAIGALRNARRSGLDLLDTTRSMNKHLAAQFGESKFVTAIVGELDTRSGMWRWVNAGHPAALIVRGGRVVKELNSVINPPLGLQSEAPLVGEERLERSDRLLLYTDGVIEARDAHGEFFGSARLVDLVSREAAAGRTAAETMRRLNLAILAHQEGFLQDDATTLMVEWSSAEARRMQV